MKIYLPIWVERFLILTKKWLYLTRLIRGNLPIYVYIQVPTNLLFMYMYSTYPSSSVSSWLMLWLEAGGEYGPYDLLEARLSISSMNTIQGARCLAVSVGQKENWLVEIPNTRCLAVSEGHKRNLLIENTKQKVKTTGWMERLEKSNDG